MFAPLAFPKNLLQAVSEVLGSTAAPDISQGLQWTFIIFFIETLHIWTHYWSCLRTASRSLAPLGCWEQGQSQPEQLSGPVAALSTSELLRSLCYSCMLRGTDSSHAVWVRDQTWAALLMGQILDYLLSKLESEFQGSFFLFPQRPGMPTNSMIIC